MEARHQGAVDVLLPPDSKSTPPPAPMAPTVAPGSGGAQPQAARTAEGGQGAWIEGAASGSAGGRAEEPLCIICFEAPRESVLVRAWGVPLVNSRAAAARACCPRPCGLPLPAAPPGASPPPSVAALHLSCCCPPPPPPPPLLPGAMRPPSLVPDVQRGGEAQRALPDLQEQGTQLRACVRLVNAPDDFLHSLTASCKRVSAKELQGVASDPRLSVAPGSVRATQSLPSSSRRLHYNYRAPTPR